MKYLVSFLKWFLVLGMVAMAALTFYQVILRFVFNNPSSWSEELARYIFVWTSLLGGALGIREGSHFGVDFLVKALPAVGKKVLSLCVYLAIIAFGCLLFVLGYKLFSMTGRQLSPALRLPMSYIYLSVPVTAVLIVVFCVDRIIALLKKPTGGETLA